MPKHTTLGEDGKVPSAQLPAGTGGLTLADVKADTDIADALTKKHASSSDNQDLSNLVVKVTGSSLVADSEIAKIHSNTLDHSNSNDHAVGASITSSVADGDTTHSPDGDVLFHALAAKENTGVAASAVSTHAAIVTGVHGLAITAGQTLTVTTGGTLGTAAYTASNAYDPAGTGNTEATDHVATHAALKTGAHGLLNSIRIQPQVTPTALTGTATLTIAQMLTGIITGNPAAAANYTLPTGTLCEGGLTIAVDEAFDWYIVNIATNATYIITLVAGTAHTIVGSVKIPSNSSTTGGVWGSSSAILRTRKTATNTFVTYRIG